MYGGKERRWGGLSTDPFFIIQLELIQFTLFITSKWNKL